MTDPTTASPDKLGIALAGGGFRASLFHLGVLHRLAELDVLRSVQVLSTVSGGSIVGAVYVLRLKRWLEVHGNLDRDQYVELVREVDQILCDGIGKNLRTRLVLNPLRTLRVLLTEDSLGSAMAGLYDRHLLREAMMRPPGGAPGSVLEPWHPGKQRPDSEAARNGNADPMALSNLVIFPGKTTISGGVDEYNARQVRSGGSAITRLVVNATTLNSGGRFLFSSVEVGDWYLGHFRRDEFQCLVRHRELLRKARRRLDEQDAPDDRYASGTGVEAGAAGGIAAPSGLERGAGLARWWVRRSRGEDPGVPEGWEALFERMAGGRFPGDLPDASLGLLRQAKVPAWYVSKGPTWNPPVDGGRSPEEHWRRILAVLGEIDPSLRDHVRVTLSGDEAGRADFLDWLIELYLVRTAERVSPNFDRDWRGLTIGDAVGASACFPPVFPPFILLGIYDDAHVTRLGLTDGGVYDNIGVTALLDEGCTSIIASDTGGAFRESPAAPSGHVGLSLRIPSILMRVVGGFQRLGLRSRRRISRDVQGVSDALPDGPDLDAGRDALRQLLADGELRGLAYFHMGGTPPEPRNGPPALDLPLDARRLAGIRTDLDAFGEVEIAGLVNHGYDTADRYVRRYLGAYAAPAWADAAPRAPRDVVGGDRVERVIDAGSSRFLRAVRLRAPVTMTVLVAGALAVAAAGLGWGVGIAGLWGYARQFARSAFSVLADIVGVLPDPVSSVLLGIPGAGMAALAWLAGVVATPLALGLAGAAATAAVVALWLRRPRSRPRRPGPVHTRLRTVRKWAASLGWNVLWLFWLLPLWIAGVTTVVAGLGWLLFYLPWRRRAEIRPGDRRQPRAGTTGGRAPPSTEALRARRLQPR